MTQVFRVNELNLIRVYLMSKGNEVDVFYNHDVPGEFCVDTGDKLTANFHWDTYFHFDSFKNGIEDIMERYGKEKMIMYLLSQCDENPSDKLSKSEIEDMTYPDQR